MVDHFSFAERAYLNCEFRRAHELLGDNLDESSTILRAKIYIESDRNQEAYSVLTNTHSRFPHSSSIAYWTGVAAYGLRQPIGTIAAIFSSPSLNGTSLGYIAQGFLHYCKNDFSSATQSLENAELKGEMEHIRCLMIAQVQQDASDISEADKWCQRGQQLIAQCPSLLRTFWQDLAEIRTSRAKKEFDQTQVLLERLETRTNGMVLPRLKRNITEAKRLNSLKEVIETVRIPNKKCADLAHIHGLTNKPILNSLFSGLFLSGDKGLSKENIVKQVWDEKYSPIMHNERIYKSIKRLNKTISSVTGRHIAQKGERYVLWI